LIVAGSLLALLVLIAVAGTSGGQHLQSSAHKIAEGVVALADYQIDSANLALTKDNFNGFKISEEGNGNSNGKKSRELKQKKNKKSKKSKNKKGDKPTINDNSDLLSVSENEVDPLIFCPGFCWCPDLCGVPCLPHGPCALCKC